MTRGRERQRHTERWGNIALQFSPFPPAFYTKESWDFILHSHPHISKTPYVRIYTKLKAVNSTFSHDTPGNSAQWTLFFELGKCTIGIFLGRKRERVIGLYVHSLLLIEKLANVKQTVLLINKLMIWELGRWLSG